ERIGSAAPGGWVRTGAFREYKSRRTFLGLPLVHVVFGRDPRTGQQRIASGWLAVGDGAAFGAVALAGGFAAGGIALAGGCSIGFLAMAGVALGVFAAGGAAIGGFVAVGGFAAAAGLAVGGAAVGRYAVGGSAAGTHVLSGERKDPDFAERLWEWVETVVDHLRPF